MPSDIVAEVRRFAASVEYSPSSPSTYDLINASREAADEIERLRAERGDTIGYAVIDADPITKHEIFAYNHPFTQSIAAGLSAKDSRSRVVVVSELPAVQP